MKIEKTEITAQKHSLVSVEKRKGPFFQSPLHYHPEIELVYIMKSSGKRIIGNSVENFESGEMILLGPDIPHVWLNDADYFQGNTKMQAESIVAYFNPNVFGPAFYASASTRNIPDLFTKAKLGIRITGNTHRIIAQKLENLVTKKDVELLTGLVEILSILANSADMELINSSVYVQEDRLINADRLTEAMTYIQNNFQKHITLEEVAGIAKITPQSFSRLFRSKTNSNFISFLLELRINHACKLMLETDLRIVEVAQNCGFNNLSNFNKQFKKIKGKTPILYKSGLRIQNLYDYSWK